MRRESDGPVIDKDGQLVLVDEVLRTNLLGPKAAGADPATNGLRMAPSPARCLRHRDHMVGCYNIGPREQAAAAMVFR